MTTRAINLVGIATFTLLVGHHAAVAGDSAPLVIKAGTLHIGDGTLIHSGTIVIQGDRIVAVGQDLAVPSGAMVIDLPTASVTPGLIDANASLESADVLTPSTRGAREILHDFFCPTHRHNAVVGCCGSSCPRSLQHVDGKHCDQCGFPERELQSASGVRGRSTAEHSSEVVPHTRVIDSINLRSPDFERLLQGGVTTVFAAPDPAAVISSQGAIIRTGGAMSKRVVRETDAIKAVMGTDSFRTGQGNVSPRWGRSISFHTRRPTTRMGVAWVFRKALYDTRRHERGEVVSGADAPGVEAMAALSGVLSGKVPLRMQARMQQDILSALRLANEFNLSFVLEDATEAHLCLAELQATKTPVIYGPIYMTPSGARLNSIDTGEARLHTLQKLLDSRIDTALTARDLREEDGLARQAMYALRFGVPMDQVTRCVTSTPARLLGIDHQVGTLERDKQADIVVWSSSPFSATSKPLIVMIGGRIVLDHRTG